MSGLEWLALGVGPLVLIGVVSNYILRQFRNHRHKQLDRVEQLGLRLSQQLGKPSAASDPALSSNASEHILTSLQESERSIQPVEGVGFSSIDPVQDSVVMVSERLADLDAQLEGENDLASLSLAALAVIYIRSHVTESIRVAEIAHSLRVSRIKLNSFLNQTLGCSAQVLINLIKMQEAKKYLIAGDLLVKEVAFQLGYMNPYHFSARFKLFFGLSPSAFQQHYQQREQDQQDVPARFEAVQRDDQPSAQNHQTSAKQESTKQAEPETSIDFMALPEGTKVDRFLIVSQVGRGGMGVVYKAYDPKLNRGVALKLLRTDRADSNQSKNRLLREAQALARLSHPNVLHVYDVGTFGEQVFMAMALVEGNTLQAWLKAQNRSVKEILRVMMAAGEGLSAAHKAGLVHRDFKPSNVIIGNDSQVKVLDFGLARVVSSPPSSHDDPGKTQSELPAHDLAEHSSDSRTNLLLTPLTHAGQLLGTPLYMAPEQFLEREADERTDMFSFCVVLYEALYGKRPFGARTMKELRSEVIRNKVIQPPVDTHVPAWLWPIIQKGLCAQAQDRHPSMALLLDQLRHDPHEERRQKLLERRRKRLVKLIVLMTIFVPIGIWFGLRYRTAQQCKDSTAELVGVWDNATQTRIQKAFLKTKQTYAQWTWEQVVHTLDHYLARWNQLRHDICEAKLLRATLSEELFDLQMSCLRNRRLELQALVNVFTQADVQVLQKAVQASSALTSIDRCADQKSLRAPYPPPKKQEVRDKVQSIRERLNQVAALEKTGRYQDGLGLVQKLESESDAVGYRPLKAAVWYQLGLLLEKTGDYKRAEATFRKAANTAGESGDGLLAAKSMAWLVWTVGYRQARHAEGLLIGQDTKVVLGFANHDESVQARFFHSLATVYWDQDNYTAALDYYKKSIAILKKLQGPTHPEVASMLNSMGLVFGSLGMFDKTQQTFQEALGILEKTLGPEHPYVAVVLTNLARDLQSREQYEEALTYLHRSLTLDEKALGPEHPELAHTLHLLGVVSWKNGQTDMALKYLFKSLTLWEKTLGPDHPYLAHPLDSLGLVFLKQGLYNKALTRFTKALAIREKKLGQQNTRLTDSLSGIGQVYLHQGKHKQAIKTLNRAISLCNRPACLPRGRFALARALIATKGDKMRSITLAQQARDLFTKKPKMFINELKQVTAWLQQHGSRQSIDQTAP